MTSDDSNNNWGGSGPSDFGSGATPDVSSAGSGGTPDAGDGTRTAHEPTRGADAPAADDRERFGGEPAQRPEPQADDRHRAGDQSGWRPAPHPADGSNRDGHAPHGQPSQGWHPGHQAQGGYPPNAGGYAPYQGGGGNYGPPPQGAPYGQYQGQGHPQGPGGQRPPASYQPPGYDYGRPPLPPPARSNSKSIAALILGIGSIVIPFIGFFLGIVAIIVSSISLKEIRTRSEQGSGMAVAGLVCGIIGTLLYFVIILLIVIFAIVGSSVDNNYDYNNFSNIVLDA